jgi:heat shock protein 1/8
LVKDNHFLGEFKLTGITPALQGVAMIDVTFDIDANGILKVLAIETSTGKSNNITISNIKGRLSKEEKEKLLLDAEKFKEEDQKQKDRIAAMKLLDIYCTKIRSSWNDEKLKNKLTESDKDAIEGKCDETYNWLDANLLAKEDEFKDKLKELEAFYNSFITKH